MKTCYCCKRELPESGFNRDASRPDGLDRRCRECGREYRQRNRDSERARWQRRAEAKRAARIMDARSGRGLKMASKKHGPPVVRNYDFLEGVKRRARTQVTCAIRRGDLARRPCEVCGEETALAHHVDYSRPLDVVWLCYTHHSWVHADRMSIWPKECEGRC